MTDLSALFGGDFTPPEAPPPIDDQIRQAMRDAGVQPPDDIKMDGSLHRFSPTGKRGDDAGWYVFHPDEPQAGHFGDWRTGLDIGWRADLGRPWTADEQRTYELRWQEAQAERERAEKARNQTAASICQKIWDGAIPASPEHPYLARKQVQPHGIRVTGDGRLIAPMFSPETWEIVSLQYIDAKGSKRYHSGGAAGGAVWLIGAVEHTLYVAEGFATGATVREHTGDPVVIAYSAHELPAACEAARLRWGDFVDLVVIADNDRSGTGQKYASQCAAKHGARVVIPDTPGDVNDFKIAGGDLGELLSPKAADWLVPADEFCSKPAPIAWLVKRWVQRDAMIMIHGTSGGGKTFVALDMACRIAGGLDDWFGCKVRPSPVVYLAGEGHHGLKQRLAAWKQSTGATGLRLWLSKGGVSLNTPEGYGKTVEAIRGLPERPGLIVVDTLHRHLDGDENSAQDTKTMLDACAAMMREFGAAVMLVHHTGVNEDAQHRARGSSAWRGALDIEISVVPAKGDKPIQIVQRKAKDTETADPLWCQLDQVPITGWTDEDGEQVTSAVIAKAEAPAERKKEQPWAKFFKVYQNAWLAGTGDTIKGGAPYITRSELIDFMVNEEGRTERAAKAQLQPGGERMIGTLVRAQILAPMGDGWWVSSPGEAAALKLLRAQPRTENTHK